MSEVYIATYSEQGSVVIRRLPHIIGVYENQMAAMKACERELGDLEWDEELNGARVGYHESRRKVKGQWRVKAYKVQREG